MPQQLTAGKAGSITIALVDDNGLAIQASAVSWTLYDDQGNSLFTGNADGFTANDATAKVTLTEAQTTIPVPTDGTPTPTTVAREAILECTTTAGVVEVREAFLIVSSVPLQLSVNSFQTLTEALVTRAGFASLPGWDAAPRNLQVQAMEEAYRRILRCQLQLHAIPTTYTRVYWYSRRVPLSRLNPDEFNALPDNFKRAVKRAQLAEANVLLGGDKVGDKRKAGIVSETIGESSMFFNSKPYLNLPISKQAYEELKSFIRLVTQIARA